jgi:Asp-tRNA(Asn)/Glu-tRNA(Gln) amidotransferase A subunit family amidase
VVVERHTFPKSTACIRICSLYHSFFPTSSLLAGVPALPLPSTAVRLRSKLPTPHCSQALPCCGVVSGFLARIGKFNPTINSIISLDPNVLVIANKMDVAPSNGNVTGSLWCIPVLLKNNYDSIPLNTQLVVFL